VIALPLLVVVADTIGIMGGYIVGTRSLGFNSAPISRTPWTFSSRTTSARASSIGGVRLHHRAHGLLSRLQFEGRRQGVGRATTNAVVSPRS
jgi:phospholipid/cholesterol/gamma-HCH transport system permease protein